MGFISTVASFGVGYAAGIVSGRQGIDRLSVVYGNHCPRMEALGTRPPRWTFGRSAR